MCGHAESTGNLEIGTSGMCWQSMQATVEKDGNNQVYCVYFDYGCENRGCCGFSAA